MRSRQQQRRKNLPAVRKEQFIAGCEEEPLALISADGNVKVSFCNLGEGLSGEYDEDDPRDVNMLRFDVYRRHEADWEAVDDASYCTLMPASTDLDTLKKGLITIMRAMEGPVTNGESVKKLGERLSWISPRWFHIQPEEEPATAA